MVEPGPVWLQRIESGEEPLPEEQKPLLEKADQAARKIERKYGKRNPGRDDFEWGPLSGRMSALAWVQSAMGHSIRSRCLAVTSRACRRATLRDGPLEDPRLEARRNDA